MCSGGVYMRVKHTVYDYVYPFSSRLFRLHLAVHLTAVILYLLVMAVLCLLYPQAQLPSMNEMGLRVDGHTVLSPLILILDFCGILVLLGGPRYKRVPARHSYWRRWQSWVHLLVIVLGITGLYLLFFHSPYGAGPYPLWYYFLPRGCCGLLVLFLYALQYSAQKKHPQP